MTREAYIQTRKTGKININDFFRFYVEQCEEKDLGPYSFEQFQQAFTMFVQMGTFSDILSKLDIYFEVQLLEDSKGNLIDVY